MYRGSPLRSTLNTSYITGLDMCEVKIDFFRVWPWPGRGRVAVAVWPWPVAG